MLEERRYAEAFERIVQARRILATTHYDPDGDAWGGLSAIAQILKRLNKNFTLYCRDQVGPKFKFLTGLDEVKNQLDFKRGDYDLLIASDCANLSRTGLSEEQLSSIDSIMEIDHHPATIKSNDDLRDENAAAACEVIYDFCRVNLIQINADLATSLLAGLITDTGHFLYSATSNRALRMAAELKASGGDLSQIDRCSGRKSLGALKLWGMAMSRLKIYDGGFAVTYLLADDFARLALNGDDLENLAGFISGIDEVKVLLILKEAEPGLIKGSLRAISSGVDVNRLARRWGGGGHTKAAGFTIKGNLAEINGQPVIINLPGRQPSDKMEIEELCLF